MEFLNVKTENEKPKVRNRNLRAKRKQKAQKLKSIHNFEDALLLEEEIHSNFNL